MKRSLVLMAGGGGMESDNDSGILSEVGNRLRNGMREFGNVANGLVGSLKKGGGAQESDKPVRGDRYDTFVSHYGAKPLAEVFSGYDPAAELPDDVSAEIVRRSDAVVPVIYRTLSDHRGAGLALPDREIVINEAHPASTREQVAGFLRTAFGHRLRALVHKHLNDTEDPSEVITDMTVILEAMMSDQRRTFAVPPLDRTNPVFGPVAQAYWLVANSKL